MALRMPVEVMQLLSSLDKAQLNTQGEKEQLLMLVKFLMVRDITKMPFIIKHFMTGVKGGGRPTPPKKKKNHKILS